MFSLPLVADALTRCSPAGYQCQKCTEHVALQKVQKPANSEA